jgi:hypothetical protein
LPSYLRREGTPAYTTTGMPSYRSSLFIVPS